MKVRKLKIDQELVYPDEGGEIIRCPVCQATWMEEDENTQSPCEHLRFVYCTHDPGFVFFAGTWDHVSFEASFQCVCDKDEGFDEMKAFKDMNHPEVDSVVYWNWDDFPLVQWSTYWGYQKNQNHRTKTSCRRSKSGD